MSAMVAWLSEAFLSALIYSPVKLDRLCEQVWSTDKRNCAQNDLGKHGWRAEKKKF